MSSRVDPSFSSLKLLKLLTKTLKLLTKTFNKSFAKTPLLCYERNIIPEERKASFMKRNPLVISCLALVPALLIGTHLASAQDDVRLTEFMASNSRTLQDEDREYSDWIEIYNGSTNSINLLNWALTDSAGNLNKWLFPATNIAPNQFLVVFASNKNRRTPCAPLH